MTNGTLTDQGAVGRRVQHAAERWWWAPLGVGLLWFLIAWLVLRANATSLATVGVLVGVVFLVSALGETLLAWLTPGGWKVWHIALAALLVIGAAWSFVRPINTFFALASVLGLLLLLQGGMYVARGVAMRAVSPYWGFTLGSGMLLALLGLWVSTSDRVWTLAARSAFILLWVGFMAIFRGISDIALAFELRRAARDMRTVDREPRDEVRPPLPVQRPAGEEREQARTDGAYGRGA
jgi:uncharacterized membrane protein HdeD (DUF308 family)